MKNEGITIYLYFLNTFCLFYFVDIGLAVSALAMDRWKYNANALFVTGAELLPGHEIAAIISEACARAASGGNGGGGDAAAPQTSSTISGNTSGILNKNYIRFVDGPEGVAEGKRRLLSTPAVPHRPPLSDNLELKRTLLGWCDVLASHYRRKMNRSAYNQSQS